MVLRHRRPSAITSGPMPSPPSTAMRATAGVSGPLIISLERLDLRHAFEEEPELVDSVQQAEAREGLERKPYRGAAGQRDRGRLDIDRHVRAGMIDEPAARRFVDDD